MHTQSTLETVELPTHTENMTSLKLNTCSVGHPSPQVQLETQGFVDQRVTSEKQCWVEIDPQYQLPQAENDLLQVENIQSKALGLQLQKKEQLQEVSVPPEDSPDGITTRVCLTQTDE